MDKQKYEYKGKVLNNFGKVISEKWRGVTLAMSYEQAKSNLAYQYKKEWILLEPENQDDRNELMDIAQRVVSANVMRKYFLKIATMRNYAPSHFDEWFAEVFTDDDVLCHTGAGLLECLGNMCFGTIDLTEGEQLVNA